MDGWTTMLYPQGAAVVGDTAFDVSFRDGLDFRAESVTSVGLARWQ